MADQERISAGFLQTESTGTNSANLYNVIDRDNVHGLNLVVPEDARAVIKTWDEREDTTKFAESGVDDQLVIHVPFTQNVRLRSILLKLGRGDSEPRQLRIYANHVHIVDFAEAEDIAPQFDISLLEGQSGVTEYPLRAAVFANIHSLSLHFTNASGETSRIYYIGFKGDTRMSQKGVTQKIEIPAANAADASLVDRAREKSGGQQSTAR